MRNSHQRTIRGSVDEVWSLVASLGGDADRLWPADRWPPMRLNHGVAPGSTGGHGFVRYTVDEVEHHDARALVSFRFAPDLGLVGTHRFEVEAIDSETVRVSHVLEGRTEGSMRVLWPLVIRPLHDALIEDAFDGAEATLAGRAVTRRSLPRGARALRFLAAAASRRPTPADTSPAGRRAADVTTAVLAGVGVLHALWALGVTWPAVDSTSLSRAVVGTTTFPSAPMTFTIAGLLAAAAVVLQARARPFGRWAVVPFPIADLGVRVITGVLALRGAGGLLISALGLGQPTAPFQVLDLAAYSPLCLALAWGTWQTWKPQNDPAGPALTIRPATNAAATAS